MSFTSHAQDQACGSSNITLNGVYLPQEWDGDFASGSGSFSGVTDLQQNEWFLQRDLDLEWKSACLHGQEETDEAAQVLTVNIKAIDGKALSTPSGFTISFKQQTSPPLLLRLESAPNPSASDKAVAESWREPPISLRLFVVNTIGQVDHEAPYHSLEDDIRDLKALQAKVKELQQAISDKKKHINTQLRKEAKNFTEELNHCDSIACILRTIADKAHGAWRVVYVHFQHNHHHDSEDMLHSGEVFAQALGHAAQISGGHLKTESSASHPYEESTVSSSTSAIISEGQCKLLCCGSDNS